MFLRFLELLLELLLEWSNLFAHWAKDKKTSS